MSDWSSFPLAEAAPTRITVTPNPQPLDITPAAPLDPRARDLAIRTIYGEAGQEPDEGMAAVAHVIRNRVNAGRYGGRDVPGVVLARNQFEPWMRPDARGRMLGLASTSPEYQRIGDIVDRVFRGEINDPTSGATHFFSPTAQAGLGRNAPTWATGQPTVIGRHNFYAPEGAVTMAANRAPAENWDAFPLAQPAGPSFAERFQGDPSTAQPNRPLQQGLQRIARAATTGPRQTSSFERMAGDYLNQGPAASQGTTPNIETQYPNLVSVDVHENDAGQLLYRDATGQMLPVDPARHVVLRDPADRRPKVFRRTEDTNEGTLANLGRVMMTGMGAGAPSRIASAAPAAAPVLRPGQEVANAAARIGVDVPRAVATDRMAAQRLAGVIRNVPGAGDPLVRATERTIGQLGQRADEVATAFGGGTVQGSGEAASSGIKNWITGQSAANATKLYDRVDELVNPTVTTPLRNTQEAVNKIQGMRDLAAIPGESGAVSQVATALQRGEGLTYEGLKGLRTSVGEMLDNKLIPPNISAKELRSIYEALSLDLRAAVQNSGGSPALSAFERANRYFRLASERRESLAKIVGADGNAAPEQVFDRLVAMAGSSSRADIGKLAQARKAMGGENWNEFVSAVIARMGRNPAAGGVPEALQAADFSPQRFLSAYSKLSKEGRAVLFRSTDRGDLAKVLDDIATVSTRFKELQKFSNPSGTGQTLSGFGIGAGAFADPVSTITAVIGGRAMAYMLSRPATAASVAQWSRSYTRLAREPSAAAVANLNIASRNLLTNLGDKHGAFSPNDFLRAIQGPVRTPAEQEQ